VKTRTKLSAALLATAAASMLSTAASADELTALKAQLDALQSRVNTMEAAPAIPGNTSLMSYQRGFGGNGFSKAERLLPQDAVSVNEDAGYTIAITPTADMPAPVAEITVYGYIGTHLHYAFDARHGDGNSFSVSTLANTGGDHISLTAKQSRFGIRSKIDTAVGQIRTHISMDFNNNSNSGSIRPRLRHAVGYWDMTPNWTFSAGQDGFTAALPVGVATVDFNGPLLSSSRAAQFRLTYTDGPLSWAVAIENPTFDSTTNMPNIASYLQYDIPGGHTFVVSGEIADWYNDGQTPDDGAVPHTDELAWVVQAGGNFNLADVATLSAGVGYGKGLLTNKFVFEDGFANINAAGDPLEAIAFTVGLSFGLTETTTFNTQFGYVNALEEQDTSCASTNPDGETPAATSGDCKDKLWKVTANIMWQPVKQMRMGWEINYGEYTRYDGTTEDGASAMFGTWFFF
jgi:hypothetical protein